MPLLERLACSARLLPGDASAAGAIVSAAEAAHSGILQVSYPAHDHLDRLDLRVLQSQVPEQIGFQAHSEGLAQAGDCCSICRMSSASPPHLRSVYSQWDGTPMQMSTAVS